MDPFIIGAGISTIGNVGANMIQNTGSKRSQRRANKYNVAQWRRQNAYNDPSSQMQRLRNAGLNPNLIYGTSPTSATGNASPITPGKAEPYQFDNPLKDVMAYANVKNTEATTDNLKEQNKVLVQEALLKAAQTGQIGIQTSKTKFDLELAEELRNTSLEAAKENLRSLKANAYGTELDNYVKSQTQKDQIEDIQARARLAKANETGQNLQNSLLDLEKELRRLGIERGDPWYFRILGRYFTQNDYGNNFKY